MKNMIFHYPSPLIKNGNSASKIRPQKMIEAFKNIGYKVFVISGYGKGRADKIEQLKIEVNKGIKFDFVYSESLTMPTALSEKHHLPIYPFLDFNFFKYCQKNNIKVGLFYRDIYWRFDELYETKSIFHKWIAVFFYYFDLYQYKKLDIIYLPSIEMGEFVPFVNKLNVSELPPGTSGKIMGNLTDNKRLNILYIGGFTQSYPMDEFISAIQETPEIDFTICTRKAEWDEYKVNKIIPANTRVVHANGDELIDLYNEADLCSLVFEPQVWRTFAFPYKFFEYLSYGKPVLAVSGTPPSRLIEKHGIGWNVDYDKEQISSILKRLNNDRALIATSKENIKEIINDFSWKSRALQVKTDLLG
jgi:glycosyltransferase involved in cell wall biosynthesis